MGAGMGDEVGREEASLRIKADTGFIWNQRHHANICKRPCKLTQLVASGKRTQLVILFL